MRRCFPSRGAPPGCPPSSAWSGRFSLLCPLATDWWRMTSTSDAFGTGDCPRPARRPRASRPARRIVLGGIGRRLEHSRAGGVACLCVRGFVIVVAASTAHPARWNHRVPSRQRAVLLPCLKRAGRPGRGGRGRARGRRRLARWLVAREREERRKGEGRERKDRHRAASEAAVRRGHRRSPGSPLRSSTAGRRTSCRRTRRTRWRRRTSRSRRARSRCSPPRPPRLRRSRRLPPEQ